MDGLFTAILDGQEREDRSTAVSEEEFAAAVRREFANGEELLAGARELHLTGRAFFASEGLENFPLLPVRTAGAFSIKKHTTSQRPYLHGQDFYELICVHGGSCAQVFGDGSALRLSEGQSCLLPPGAAGVAVSGQIHEPGTLRLEEVHRNGFAGNTADPGQLLLVKDLVDEG